MKNFKAEKERRMKWGWGNVNLNGVLQVGLAEKGTSEQIQTGEGANLQLSGEEQPRQRKH